jgi:hypothetical protein
MRRQRSAHKRQSVAPNLAGGGPQEEVGVRSNGGPRENAKVAVTAGCPGGGVRADRGAQTGARRSPCGCARGNARAPTPRGQVSRPCLPRPYSLVVNRGVGGEEIWVHHDRAWGLWFLALPYSAGVYVNGAQPALVPWWPRGAIPASGENGDFRDEADPNFPRGPRVDTLAG